MEVLLEGGRQIQPTKTLAKYWAFHNIVSWFTKAFFSAGLVNKPPPKAAKCMHGPLLRLLELSFGGTAVTALSLTEECLVTISTFS